MTEITEKQIKEGLEKAYKKAGHNAYFANGFEAGVKFVQDLVEKLTIPVDSVCPDCKIDLDKMDSGQLFCPQCLKLYESSN